MRKTTLLWLILAAFCGTVLFHTSQKVHDEREKLTALNTSIGKEEESLRVLNAEWGYLNQPERLEKLSKTYLNLVPLKGSQFVKAEDLPLRGTVVAMIIPKPSLPAMPPKGRAALLHLQPAAQPQFIKAHAVHAWPDPALRRGGEVSESATNTRSFTDVMKSLHTGVE